MSPCHFILQRLELVQSGLVLEELKDHHRLPLRDEDGLVQVVNAPLLPPITSCRVSPASQPPKLTVLHVRY